VKQISMSATAWLIPMFVQLDNRCFYSALGTVLSFVVVLWENLHQTRFVKSETIAVRPAETRRPISR
jgi:hypothetical protein